MKKSNGFTLVEVIVAATLAATISIVGITCTAKYLSLYTKENTQIREELYVDEAINFIEYEIKSGRSVQVSNNKIIIELSSGVFDDIKLSSSGGGSVVIWYDSGGLGNSNNILKNVSTFDCQSKGNLIYININTLKGNNYRRCINIVNEQ